MTCDRIWRKCLVSKLAIPPIWRNSDADNIQGRHEVFWIEVTPKEALGLVGYVNDEDHKARIAEALRGRDEVTRGFFFIVTRGGSFVQYYPFLGFNESGIAWEKIGPVAFSDFKELDRMIPKPLRHYPGDL